MLVLLFMMSDYKNKDINIYSIYSHFCLTPLLIDYIDIELYNSVILGLPVQTKVLKKVCFILYQIFKDLFTCINACGSTGKCSYWHIIKLVST